MDCTPTTSSGDISDNLKIQCATDSMFVCMEMLKSLNYINDKPNPSPSLEAIHFGNEMANLLISMIEEFKLSEMKNYFLKIITSKVVIIIMKFKTLFKKLTFRQTVSILSLIFIKARVRLKNYF